MTVINATNKTFSLAERRMRTRFPFVSWQYVFHEWDISPRISMVYYFNCILHAWAVAWQIADSQFSKKNGTTTMRVINRQNVIFLNFFGRDRPPVGQGHRIHEVSSSHTTTHHSRQDSPGRVISSSQRPLPDNTQPSQQTNIHAPSGIRTHSFSRRAATDSRLRLRGHWDRQNGTWM